MMMDTDIVAVSPSSVYRVLTNAGLLNRWNCKESKKGTGFVQPLKAHEHWHIDISYINICGTFYYICSILDGFSRYIVHWEIRESMKESDVEIILQRAREKFPDAKPRISSDNGPQFIAKDFKEFIKVSGMTHVKTILQLILQSMSNKEIANILYRSVRTIEVHRSHIMHKLDVDSIVDLVKRATTMDLDII